MTMYLNWIDWSIIGGVFLLTMIIGLSSTKEAGKSKADYFVGGRAMPWWLLGFSMVATTFSTDTPNLVANFVREYGVCGNWVWWSMLPSGMLTVFLYAKLWRRSHAITDLEFYEIRYSGKLAAFLRGFRAVYLGLFFNVIVMASVTLAAIKIGGTMLHLTPVQSVAGAMIITAIFSSAAGLRGVLKSDFLLFILSMIGAVAAAYFAVTRPDVGGLDGMMQKFSSSDELLRKSEVMGFASWTDVCALFIIPLTIIWWSIWYPGSEPGGGGYLVQRMLAAKDEKNAVGAVLFFNVAHYALRPWPWIIVALASLIVYPDRASLIAAVNGVLPDSQVQSDVAYSLMLRDLPVGWKGVMVASLIAAYISTISTMLNWGSSYLVNDFYTRFIRKNASEKESVQAGRVFTLLLMLFTGILALFLDSALESFTLILSIGAGTGLLFLLRWFWWRINAAAEITAMITSFCFACYFNLLHDRIFPTFELSTSEKMVYAIILTTITWIIACYFGPKTDDERLFDFCKKINPSGRGWDIVRKKAYSMGVNIDNPEHAAEPLLPGIIASVFGCLAVYGALYGTGEVIYSHTFNAAAALSASAVCAVLTWYFGMVVPRKKLTK